MRRRILSLMGTAALFTAALVGMAGCTASAGPDAGEPQAGLAFDREQVASDIPQDLPLESDNLVEESFRLIDNSTVDGVEFYIAQSTYDGTPSCVIVVRVGTSNAVAGCGPTSVKVSGQGIPTTEFYPELPIEAEREGWISLGSGVWVAD